MTDEQGYGLVMPFTCVTSKGGPYPDDAFVAGYRCGQIDAALEARPERHTVFAEPGLRHQLDLIAMRHEYVLVVDAEAHDWLHVSFWRKPAFGLFDRDELDEVDPSSGLT